jgi:hypothetical protein
MALTLVAAGCAPRVIDLLQIPAGPQPVIIRVLCPTATNVSIAVLPERVPVARGRDSVLWVVIGQGTQIEIAPKNLNRWPFDNPPHVGTRGQAANSGVASARAQLGSYSYNVTAQCQVPNNGPVITISIDPDVIITNE